MKIVKPIILDEVKIITGMNRSIVIPKNGISLSDEKAAELVRKNSKILYMVDEETKNTKPEKKVLIEVPAPEIKKETEKTEEIIPEKKVLTEVPKQKNEKKSKKKKKKNNKKEEEVKEVKPWYEEVESSLKETSDFLSDPEPTKEDK